jgi:hypothetical protein
MKARHGTESFSESYGLFLHKHVASMWLNTRYYTTSMRRYNKESEIILFFQK